MQLSAKSLPLHGNVFALLWQTAGTATWRRAISGIIAFGIVLRLVQYIGNRSLWLDEAMLALNIVQKSPFELLGHLEYDQAAPVGFLIIESLFVNIFGNSEYVLRLLPLLGGIASLFLFYAVARRVLNGHGLIAATALFALSAPLVRYSSEIKQYSTDVAVAIGVLLAAFLWSESSARPSVKALVLGVSGSILIWFSHPVVFVLAALGLGLTYQAVKLKQYREIVWLAFSVVLWLVSFWLSYHISLHEVAKTPQLLEYWSEHFAPFPPVTASDLLWYPRSLLAMFKNPVGMEFVGLGCVLFGVGIMSMLIHKTRHWSIITLPLPITILASMIHKYPFSNRLLFFLVPTLILCIGRGIGEIAELAKSSRMRYSIIVILWSVLLYYPAISSARSLEYPADKNGTRGVLDYIADNYKEGDVIYVYRYSVPAIRFYALRYFIDKNSYRFGESATEYLDEIKRLRGNHRVWLVFSHIKQVHMAQERSLDVKVLDKSGERLDAFELYGYSAYLYDLR